MKLEAQKAQWRSRRDDGGVMGGEERQQAVRRSTCINNRGWHTAAKQRLKLMPGSTLGQSSGSLGSIRVPCSFSIQHQEWLQL
eukprot:scaffold145590_cov23-Tisochrysis_lutea.AAC.1